MIGDDDWASFYDPDEFGCEVALVGDADTLELLGRELAPPELDRLRQGERAQAGVRAKPGERVVEIPAKDLPADWPDRRVDVPSGSYTAVDVQTIGRLRVGLILVPYETRETTHGQWLRDPDGAA